MEDAEPVTNINDNSPQFTTGTRHLDSALDVDTGSNERIVEYNEEGKFKLDQQDRPRLQLRHQGGRQR